MPTPAENIARRSRLRAEHAAAIGAISESSGPLDDAARRELETALVDVPRRPLEASRAG